MRPFDLFLSHNSEDKPAVREIAKALRKRGLRVWLDEDDLVAGRPWQEALEKVIESVRAAAVLVGKDGLGPWENLEMRACLSELVDRDLPVIPVLLPGAPGRPKLPLFLRAVTWVDLRNGITEEKLDRLAVAIPKRKRKLRQPRRSSLQPDADSFKPPRRSKVTVHCILFLGANPDGMQRLRLDREFREIDSALRRSDFRESFDLRQQTAVRSSDLQAALLRYRPQIVHFSGHGQADGIYLEDETGKRHKAQGNVVARILREFKTEIRCVVLNSCYTRDLAEAIAIDIECVIGMSAVIGDPAAIQFSSAFYQALAFGSSVGRAFNLACGQIDLIGLEEGNTPQLVALRSDPKELVFVDEESAVGRDHTISGNHAGRERNDVADAAIDRLAVTMPERNRLNASNSTTGQFDLFMIYNSNDTADVAAIAQRLKRRHFRLWLDVEQRAPGRNWLELAQEGIRASRAVAVFVGPSGIGAWQDQEMRVCLELAVQQGLIIFPVLLPGSPHEPDLPLSLKVRIGVDLRDIGVTAKEALDLLIFGITGKKPRHRPLSRSKHIVLSPALSTVKQKEGQPSRSSNHLTLPTLHNLPFSTSLGDRLKGRIKDLNRVAQSLHGDGQGRAIVHVIYGLSGIGKTRLAVEYALRFGYRYRVALFVSANSRERLTTEFVSLAAADLLDLPERLTKDPDEIKSVVFRWMKSQTGWLLILDNIDSRDAKLATLEVLPRLAGGHVLITSLLKDWPPSIGKQELHKISLRQSRDLLLVATRGERLSAADDIAQAEQLAKKFDGLPLGLEQAGAYIARNRLSFSKYLEAWEKDPGKALTWHDEMAYPTSMAVTWRKTFDRLRPKSLAILRLTAFFDLTTIPAAIFESATSLLQEAVTLLTTESGTHKEDWDSVSEALAELEGYSLISRHNDSFTVHHLVQQVLRLWIPSDTRRLWFVIMLELANRYSSSMVPTLDLSYASWSAQDARPLERT